MKPTQGHLEVMAGPDGSSSSYREEEEHPESEELCLYPMVAMATSWGLTCMDSR